MKKIIAIGNKNKKPETILVNFDKISWVKVIPKYEDKELTDKKLIKLGIDTNYTISKEEWEVLQTYLQNHPSMLEIITLRGDLYYISITNNKWIKIKEKNEEENSRIITFTKSTTTTVSEDYYQEFILPKLQTHLEE